MSKYAVALFAVLLVGCHKPAPSTVSADMDPKAIQHAADIVNWMSDCHHHSSASASIWRVATEHQRSVLYLENSFHDPCSQSPERTVSRGWTYTYPLVQLRQVRRCASALNAKNVSTYSEAERSIGSFRVALECDMLDPPFYSQEGARQFE